MQHLPHIHYSGLCQGDDARDLQSAGGRTGAAAHKHQQHQHCFGKDGPLPEIHRGVAGCGDNGGHLKESVAQRRSHRVVQRQDVGGNGRCGRRHDAEIHPQLLGAEHLPKAAHQQEKVQIKIDAEGQHPDTDDNVDIRAVVGPHAGVPAGKAAGTGGAEGMDTGVKQIHAPQHQQQNHNRCHHKINAVEDFCRVAHAAHQFARRRPRHLRPEDVHGMSVAHG